MGCGECIGDLLTYETVKVVRVHDKRLGFLHYFLMFLIFCYVVGYTIVWQKRYLLEGVPIGSIRMSLKEPSVRSSPSQLPYCYLPNQTHIGKFENYNCSYWDEAYVLYPSVEERAMFLSTRVNITSQQVQPENCSLTEPDCDYVDDDADVQYIADIEDFTIMLEHTMFVPVLGKQAVSTELKGQMVGTDGKPLKFPAGSIERVGIPGKTDIFKVGTLLKAAGIKSLDGPAQTDDGGPPVSMRYDGLVLLCFIDYSNTFSYNLNDIQYTYNVTLVRGTKFKASQPVFTKNLSKRVIWTRHGIRILFLHSGNIGAFDIQTLILSMVAGLGLVAVSTVIVDTLATKILPAKKIYNKAKFEETKDIRGGIAKMFDSEEESSSQRESVPVALDKETSSYNTFV